MFQMTVRVVAGVAGVGAAFVVTNKYYAEIMEFMTRMESISHAAIPVILSVILVYHVAKNATKK
jgi:hypothetical protein